jgi:hypothetical protein
MTENLKEIGEWSFKAAEGFLNFPASISMNFYLFTSFQFYRVLPRTRICTYIGGLPLLFSFL